VTTRDEYGFTFPLRVRYAEVDQQGVVFNAHYLTYYDTAITEYFRTLEYDLFTEAHVSGADFHTVRCVVEYKVEYKAPIRFDDELDVAVRAARIGRSSLTLLLAIFPKGSGDLLATGEVVWVNTDQTARKPTPIPDRLRTVLKQREGSRLVES
jgi:acyl-CoA thioester hydrolase